MTEHAKTPLAAQVTSERTAAPQTSETAAAPAVPEAAAPKRRSPKTWIAAALLIVAGVGAGRFGYHYVTEGRFLVTTDNAYVKADVTTLAAKLSGYVIDVAQPNSAVRQGDVIARIDDGDYRLSVDAARAKLGTQLASIERFSRQVEAQDAMLAQARAQLAAAQADSTRAESDYQRATQLAAADYGSKQRLDSARADRDRTLASVEAAKANVVAAQANIEVTRAQQNEARALASELRTALERAERDLSFTTVTAPVDGVVGNRAAERGNFVQPGTRLAVLVPLRDVYVEANFKETQLPALKAGQPVDLEIDALPGRTIRGRVESFAPASGSIFSLLPPENATGNFTKIVQRVPVRISIVAPLPEEVLRPGLSVIAHVLTGPGDAAESAAGAAPPVAAR